MIYLEQEWYTFSEASRLVHRNRNYFSNRYRLNPELFKGPNFKEMGGIKFISQAGVKEILSNIKKTVDQLKNRVFNWLT